jgi:hypothetical protein
MHFRTALISGALLLVIGVIAWAATQNDYNVCHSLVGQFGQALSQSANNTCTEMTFIHTVGIGMFIIGILFLGYSLVMAIMDKD